MPEKKRTFYVLIFVAATILFIYVPVAEAAKTSTPNGPYQIGVKIESMKFDGRDMLIMVWYPALPQKDAKPYKYNTGVKGSAFLNAPAEKKAAPYPMILFSHGLGGCGCGEASYNENLASYGFVVVAPDHKDSAMCHIKGKPDITAGQITWAYITTGGNLHKSVMKLFGKFLSSVGYDFSYRSAEVKAVISEAISWNYEGSSFYHGLIDPDKIGMSGHSLGGFTTLMIGGTPFVCKDSNPSAFDAKKPDRKLFDTCSAKTFREMTDPFQLRDKRVKAIISLAPPMFVPDMENAATKIEIPIMFINGDNKKMESEWEPIFKFYSNAPPPKYAVRLKKTDHMTISDATHKKIITRLALPGTRCHYRDKIQAYKDYSSAFFKLYLKDDHSGEAILNKPTNPFVELWHQGK